MRLPMVKSGFDTGRLFSRFFFTLLLAGKPISPPPSFVMSSTR